jgi:hypothetical protein
VAAPLNRALLARQLLLERSRRSIPRSLERVAGLQAQYAPSMYIGDRIRLDSFESFDRGTRRELHEEAERLAEFHV